MLNIRNPINQSDFISQVASSMFEDFLGNFKPFHLRVGVSVVTRADVNSVSKSKRSLA